MDVAAREGPAVSRVLKTPERVSLAQDLREDGLLLREIGDVLGVSLKAIHEWLLDAEDPAFRIRRNATKRAWDAEHDRRPCACGALRPPGVHRRSPNGHCATCAREILSVGRAMRCERIYEAWHEGLSLAAIAKRLDSTVNSIGVTIVHMRQEGWDMPYRRKPRATA